MIISDMSPTTMGTSEFESDSESSDADAVSAWEKNNKEINNTVVYIFSQILYHLYTFEGKWSGDGMILDKKIENYWNIYLIPN